MVAIKYKELLENDSLEHDDRYEINHFTKIDHSVRLEPFVVIDENVTIGANTIIGPFVQIRSNTVIGKDCRIGGNTVLEGSLVIGDHVRLGSGSNLGWGSCIGNNVFIGNQFVPANDNLMVWGTDKEKDFKPKSFIVEDNVRIGINCTALAGITIGKNSIIGAKSLITKNIPPNVLAYGHPAKVIRKI